MAGLNVYARIWKLGMFILLFLRINKIFLAKKCPFCFVQPCKIRSSTLASHPSLSVWLWLFDAAHTWFYSTNLLFSWRSLYRPHASRRAGYSRSPASWVPLIDRLIDIFLLIEAHKSPFLRGQNKVSNTWNENTGRWQIFMTTWQILTVPKGDASIFPGR